MECTCLTGGFPVDGTCLVCYRPAPDPKCPTCDGHGFQAGAHTERVNDCPTCNAEAA